MHCMNNMVVFNHHGLLIYLDTGYFSSFHDVTIMCQSNLYKNWCQFFVHIEDYVEYLLWDLCYVGEEMFMV
jgi:hypothetical protein